MMKVGMVGVGCISGIYLKNFKETFKDVQLVAVCDLIRERAEKAQKEYNIPKIYDTMEELFADPEIDIVLNLTRPYQHYEVSKGALEAGKHVYSEKPLGADWEEGTALVKLAQEKGLWIGGAPDTFMGAGIQTCRKLIDEGLIGNIVSFRTTFGHGGPETWSINPGKNTWFFDKSKAAMGVMADLGVHKTDLIHFLTGERVIRTTAKLTTLDKRGEDGELIGVDDNAFCIYELTGGIVGTMTASWTFYGAEDNSTILYGTKGIMRIYDDPAHSIVVKLADGEEKFYDVEQIQTNDNQTKSGVIDLWVD